jgi:anti-sigma B factor antagonist
VAFTIEREQFEEGGYAVAVAGDVDLHAAPALKRELLDAVARGGRTIVADLAGATLFDSTPLGVLLAVSKRLEATDARLSVVCSGALLAFVERTGLDELLHVVASRDALLSPSLAVADVA